MLPSILTVLQGHIERITYTKDETGYTVSKVKVYGRRDLVTVIVAIINPTPGTQRSGYRASTAKPEGPEKELIKEVH